MIEPATQLIENIYEAAIVPETWPAVLDDLSRQVDAAGTGLFSLRLDQPVRWTASEPFRPLLNDWFAGGWQSRTQRAPRMIGLRHPGFVSDLDVFEREELDRQPDQVEFLRPRGYGWGAGTFVDIPNGDVAIYTLERRFATGPFDRASIALLDALRPHLARSALLATRLGLERAKSAVGTLEELGIPAAVLGRDARVLAANDLLEGLDGQIAFAAFGRIRLAAKSAQDRLSEGLARIAQGEVRQSTSIGLKATPTSPAAVLHLVPICGSAHDIFAQSLSLLLVSPLARPSSPEAGILSGLFDLTPSEARVAKSIGEGRTVGEIASDHAVGVETVRSQLKSVLAKVGVSRQSDLVGLLAGLTLRSG